MKNWAQLGIINTKTINHVTAGNLNTFIKIPICFKGWFYLSTSMNVEDNLTISMGKKYTKIRVNFMMTSSNGNIFRFTGHLCGEFTGHRWIPRTKASDAELWCFLWSAPWINGWVNNSEAGDLRRHHYDVIVMLFLHLPLVSEWHFSKLTFKSMFIIDADIYFIWTTLGHNGC